MRLFNNLKKFGDKPALIFEEKKISFFELENFSNKNDFLKKNSLVLLISDNSLEAIKFYVLLMKSKNISLMLIDIKTNLKAIYKTINIYKFEYIIFPTKIFEITNIKYRCILNFDNYLVLERNIFSTKKIDTRNKLMLTTSGSMGSSKFVCLSHENLKFNSKQIKEYLRIKKNDKAIITMPISYSYMLSIINTHLDIGCTIYANQNSIFQKSFWDYFKKNKINSFSGVPFHFNFLEKNNFKFLNIKSIKYFTCAGGALDRNIILKIGKFCKKKKIKFFSMYGQTEASPRISYLPYKYLNKKTESIGKGLIGTKIWIENKFNKKIFTPNKIGELVCKGKNIFLGYSYTRKDLEKKINKNFFLRTGDLAYFDEDNFFYICGRKSRLAKIFGIRINLDELEKKLSSKNVNVICKSEKDKIYLFINKKINNNKLLDKAEKITLQNKMAFHVVFVKEFPLTTSNKINYTALKVNED